MALLSQAGLSIFQGQRVLVTGHTGFKGAWLIEWLLSLGAEVYGIALPPLKPSLFTTLGLENRITHNLLDIQNAEALTRNISEIRPHFIFHLAAQALVRPSYRDPVLTFSTNALGTANVLEAVRHADFPCTIVAVTTDKCYANDGQPHVFRETDPLGGHDPYSASKAAAELIIASYRDSYFRLGTKVALASARAGNVVGGGDWAEDRLVPDGIRALQSGRPIPVRNPAYTRPWQHVLDPLGGYLLLGAKLEEARRTGDPAEIARYAQAFNFGPEPAANRSVHELVEELLRYWPGTWKQVPSEAQLKEAHLLSLSIDKARNVLGWQPRWDFAETIAQTMAWYRKDFTEADQVSAIELTRQQIKRYAAL